MNPLAVWFVSGIGYLALLAASISFAVGGWYHRYSRLGHYLSTCALLLALVAFFSGSVVPSMVEIVAGVSLAVGVLLMPIRRWSRKSSVATMIGIAFLVVGLGYELRNSIGIRMEAPVSELVVVGDSLSAGIQPDETTWPKHLAQIREIPVHNLSAPGARVAQGKSLIGDRMLDGSTVIILLGGNDMLGGGSSESFERELLHLVRLIKTRGGIPWLIQFPSLPSKGSFPAATARVARAEEVGMIPRWVLARVFAQQGSTVDGLHLSPSGHQALAQAVANWIPID